MLAFFFFFFPVKEKLEISWFRAAVNVVRFLPWYMCGWGSEAPGPRLVDPSSSLWESKPELQTGSRSETQHWFPCSITGCSHGQKPGTKTHVLLSHPEKAS